MKKYRIIILIGACITALQTAIMGFSAMLIKYEIISSSLSYQTVLLMSATGAIVSIIILLTYQHLTPSNIPYNKK